jgi:predicted dehydrogenase
MSKIKIGVLSTANIAIKSVIPNILSLNEHFEFVGVASREIENKSLDSDIDLIEGYDNLIENYNLDAVYIPLPNAMHFEWVKKALNNGINVLVEKSLACNLKQAKELNHLAKEKNLALLENFQFRFHSQLNYITNLLSKGTIGDIRVFRSTFCFPPFPSSDNIRYNKDLGGGALLDAGAYPLKLSQLILGNDLEVSSAVLNYGEDGEVDIWGGVFLRQKQGNLFSQIAFGFDNYYQCNLEIIGSKGKLYTNRLFTAKEGFIPMLVLETNEKGLQNIELKSDNHFKNMLLYFKEILSNKNKREEEYIANINQAKLLEDVRNKSNNKEISTL